MKNAFPEIAAKEEEVIAMILDEEESFGRTIEKGLAEFEKRADAVQKAGGVVFPGEDAFYLYDTMGFPVDLTQLMSEERKMNVDIEGFHANMAKQKAASQADQKSKKGGKLFVLKAAETAYLSNEGVAATDYQLKYQTDHQPQATVKAIFTDDGFLKENGDVADVGIVMDRTSFYAESGGQIFDTGMLTSPDGKLSIRIDNVQTFGAYVLHVGVVESGEVKVGDEVACHVDYDRRRKVTPNHTMTHVLNWALRKVLVREEKKEKIVDQKGSSVDDERLRFDFTCNKAIAPKSLAKVEKICQEWVANKMPIYTQLAPLQDAMRVQSLRAVFGEKYPDPVRMVSIGQDIQTVLDDPDNAKWEDFSIEFCGGTTSPIPPSQRDFSFWRRAALPRESVVWSVSPAARLRTRKSAPRNSGLVWPLRKRWAIPRWTHRRAR